MKQLTRDRAAAIFSKYAFYVSSGDVIPEETARRILSDEAVNYAKKQEKAFSIFGVGGDRQFYYLTFSGFMAAVSWYNVESLFTDPAETESNITVLPFRSAKG